MTIRRKRWVWAGCIMVGLLLAVASFRLDGTVHRWQQRHLWKNIQLLSRNVTRGTDWPAHMVLGGAMLGLAWWRGQRKWTRIFAAMLLAGALAGVAAYPLKFTTGRVRPSVHVEKGWRGPERHQNYQAFPSGHTAVSAGFFAVLLFVRWRLGLFCFFFPLFVGFTRIFLGAHYLSDVVCGILLGILAAAIVTTLMFRREEPSALLKPEPVAK